MLPFLYYIFITCTVSLTLYPVNALSDTYQDTVCDVTEPWYCDTGVSSQDTDHERDRLLRFEYRNKEDNVDVVGEVLRQDDAEETNGYIMSCDTCCDRVTNSKLQINELNVQSDRKCYQLTLQGNCRSTHQLCLDTTNALWYGGSELHHQRWPLNQATMAHQPYISNDFVTFTTSYGNVIERIWMNSRGVGIYIDENIPLYVAMNEKQICFAGQYSKHFRNLKCSPPGLNITICDTNNVRETFKVMHDLFVDKVEGVPDERMFKSPIWSTWAKYKTQINQATILSYADEIVVHGFSNSQLEIDDMYSSTYGDLDFDPVKFENAHSMISELKSKGFRVTAWVTPFANLDSEAFQDGMRHSYWLESQDGTPALVKWWQGIGAVLDVTNKDAVDWFIERLNRMKNVYGVDSFKFDAGETNYVPSSSKPKVPWDDTTTYATKYVEAVSQMGAMIEVRCGYRSQRHPVFVRMADKESRWGYENGLQTLIPTVLTLGILGYPYILPDMIGGNGYNYDDIDNPFVATKLPERELYIRWLEVTSYFPAMQFSFVPWQYDEEVVEIARKYVSIHEDVVTPVVLQAAKESQTLGTPIIRPLWWHDADDINTLESDSEFLVGDSLLVAPILEKGTRQRDIYIPHGVWEDQLHGNTINGPYWLRNYKINLDEIATFWLKDKL